MAEKAEAAKATMEEESARSREEGEEARRRAEDLDVLFASSSGDVKRLLREIGSLGQVREGSRWSEQRCVWLVLTSPCWCCGGGGLPVGHPPRGKGGGQPAQRVLGPLQRPAGPYVPPQTGAMVMPPTPVAQHGE